MSLQRITFVIPDMSSGGAQHALAIIAREWDAKGRKITVLTTDHGAEPSFYKLSPSIRHIALAIAGDSRHTLDALRKNLNRVAALRRAIRETRPDVLISFIDQTNVVTLLATRGLGTPVIVVEQNDPHTFPIKPIWNQLRRITYRRAARIVLLSARDAYFFPPGLRKHVTVIPNPFVPPADADNGSGSGAIERTHQLIAVGRLHRNKGLDLLLEGFSLLKDLHPDWQLTVLGEGDERGRLEQIRNDLGLTDRVNFAGRVRDPYSYLRRSDLFVMPSRTEGFPLALCEALACGLPAICSDCAGGVRDIIEDGVNGVLVPNGNSAALAHALDRLMGDAGERQRLAERAPEVVERFSIAKVMNAWEKLLSEVVRIR